MLNPAHTQTNHRTIIDIRVKLIVELEVPATWLAFLVFHLPVADMTDLLLQNPVGGLHHARVVFGYSGFTQGKQRIRRIPYWRLARLHAEAIFFLNSQLFKFIHRADDL